MKTCIYTLANDVVLDQLIALLNSIEVNVGSDFPVRVVAYSDPLDKVREEVRSRKNVELLEAHELFLPWEEFSKKAWANNSYAQKVWREKGVSGVYRLASNHRYFAFDQKSDFEKFIYFDADVLVLNPIDFIIEKLDEYQFVTYDFQYKDPGHIYNLNSPRLFEIFPESRIRSEIFCAGCFAGRRGLFSEQERNWIIDKLQSGEGEILYPSAPNQSLLNYMKMRLNLESYNFALELDSSKKTGNSVTSSHFQCRDNILYDKGERLTYLHYIGLPAQLFTRLCQGENIDFPYRDLFLYYRYLKNPEQRPVLKGSPKSLNSSSSFFQKINRKFTRFIKRFSS